VSETLTLLLIFAGSAILFSFLCSLWESVLLSITPSYVHEQDRLGRRIGARLKEFKANIDIPLGAILTLNTIAHTGGAIGVGEQATILWANSNPLITGVVVPIAMTMGILILSEIIPKTIGANYWQRFVPFTVYSLNVLIVVLYPVIWMIQLITRTLRKDESAPVLTRSQFLTLADVGEQEGVLDGTESEIIKSLLLFREIQVRAVMTPRTVTRMAPANMTMMEFMERYPDARFSRIPIYESDKPENVVGYVLKDDVLQQLSAGDGDAQLNSLRRDILMVSETVRIPQVFNQFLEKREHIALVVDEFGNAIGVVTLEDVIETMLGLEIVDEKDRTDDMQEVARRTWQRRARQLGLLDE